MFIHQLGSHARSQHLSLFSLQCLSPSSSEKLIPSLNSLTTFHQLNKCLPQAASSLTQFISTYHQSSSSLTHCHCGHSLSYPDSKQDSNQPVSPSSPLSSLSSPSKPCLPKLPNFFQSRNLIKMFPAQKLLWLSTTNLNLNCLAYYPGVTVIWVPICSSSLIFHQAVELQIQYTLTLMTSNICTFPYIHPLFRELISPNRAYIPHFSAATIHLFLIKHHQP